MSAPDERDPTRAAHVGRVLDTVTVLSRAILEERRTPFCGRALTESQLHTLYFLSHQQSKVTLKRLARALNVTSGAVTQLIHRLLQEQLVETAPHPHDARSRIIKLTPTAQQEIDIFERATVERLLPMFDDIDEQELANLANILARIQADPTH